MADSEKDPKPTVEVTTNLPPGVTSLVVRNVDGTFRESLKNAKGHFVKKVKPLPSAHEMVRKLRKRLEQNITGGDQQKLMEIFDFQISIANGTCGCDPKAQMAAVKAFEAIWLRAYGKPSLSDDEKEALKHDGVRIVIVEAPQCLPAAEEAKEEKKQPSFADVLNVTTNPQA